MVAGTSIAALGDGAHRICDGYAQHLPQQVEILDIYHAGQYLALRVAQVMHAEDAAVAAAWLAVRRHELRHLVPWRLQRELAAWMPCERGSEAARKVRSEELGYFVRNRKRLNYPDYARHGFPVGCGAVEGACKHLVSALQASGDALGDRDCRTANLPAGRTAEPTAAGPAGYPGATLTH